MSKLCAYFVLSNPRRLGLTESYSIRRWTQAKPICGVYEMDDDGVERLETGNDRLMVTSCSAAPVQAEILLMVADRQTLTNYFRLLSRSLHAKTVRLVSSQTVDGATRPT